MIACVLFSLPKKGKAAGGASATGQVHHFEMTRYPSAQFLYLHRRFCDLLLAAPTRVPFLTTGKGKKATTKDHQVPTRKRGEGNYAFGWNSRTQKWYVVLVVTISQLHMFMGAPGPNHFPYDSDCFTPKTQNGPFSCATFERGFTSLGSRGVSR